MAGTSEEIETCSIGNFKLGLSESKLLLLIKILIFICLGGFEFEKSINFILAGWMDNLLERKKYIIFWNSELTWLTKDTRSGPEATSLVSSANNDLYSEEHLERSLI